MTKLILLILFFYPDSAVVVDTIYSNYMWDVLGIAPGNRPILRKGDTIYLVYPQKAAYLGGPGRLLFTYSWDNGQTWANPIPVTPWDSLGGDEPNLFFDKYWKLHCVWRQQLPSKAFCVVHSVYENGSWAPPEVLTSGVTGAAGFSSVVVDTSGIIHVVYDYPISSGMYDIFYTKYENGQWSTPINLSTTGYCKGPSITVDSKGNLHVVWMRGHPSSLHPIVYRRCENGYWLPPEIISDTCPTGRAGIICDFNDVVHAIFGGINGKIYHTFLTDTGWSSPSLIPTRCSTTAYIGSISVDSLNILYLFWNHFLNNIYYSTYDGNKWSLPFNITNDPYPIYIRSPRVANPVTSKGIALVWAQGIASNTILILYMKLSPGMINIKEKIVPLFFNKKMILLTKIYNLEIFDIAGRKVKNLKSGRKYFIRKDKNFYPLILWR